MAKPEKFIQKGEKAGTIRPGGLHRSLGIPEGEKIPADRIDAAAHSDNPRERKQANLAKVFAHIRPSGHKHASVAHQHPSDRFAHSGV